MHLLAARSMTLDIAVGMEQEVKQRFDFASEARAANQPMTTNSPAVKKLTDFDIDAITEFL